MKKFQKIVSALTAAVMSCSMAAISMFTPASAADKTATEIVNDMGLGWNLGNTFDCWNTRGWTTDTETAWGNIKTTQAMIDAVKAAGFDSIRIPITWYENMDASTYDIDDAYLARIKEVVDYAYANDMYVIMNMHWDWVSDGSLWLNKGMDALPQYQTMWTEIANYFKDYDNHLVFESMNEVTFDYDTLNTFNQKFVDLMRASGGNNSNRLLLLAGANTDLTKTCTPEFVVPDDKMVAVSIHYYYPSTWAVATVSDPNAQGYWGYRNDWGTDDDKQEVYNTFAKVKAYFADEGIPVIFGEYGVVTNCGKDHDSIVSYLDTIASSALATDGVTAFLWDAGDAGDMQYFSRKNLSWFDEDYMNVYKNLKENGTQIEFEYDIKKTSDTSDRATVTPTKSGDDYKVDLAPYAGKGVTIKEVQIKGKGGWGMAFEATNLDGSRRDWTSEAGTDTITVDGIFEGDNGSESYTMTMVGDLTFQLWWDKDDAYIDSVTLVFDKPISYTATEVSVTAKQKEQTPTEATEATEDTSETEIETPPPTEWTEPTEDTSETQPETPAPTESTEPTEDTVNTESDNPEMTASKVGDADDNGEVDILDVITINKAIMGKENLSDKGLANIDFNKNGKPDSNEAMTLLKLIVGLITEQEALNS